MKYRVACEIYPKEFQRAGISPTSLIYFSKKTHFIETPIIIQKVGLAK